MPIKVHKELLPTAQFIRSWLSNRKRILGNNITNYNNYFHSSDFLFPTQEINRQLNNLSTVKLIKSKPSRKDWRAQYSTTNHSITYTDPSDLIHEGTHALRYGKPWSPQEFQIRQSPYYQRNHKDPYWDNDSEIYARLMQFRKDNNLNPNQVWTKDQIKALKKNSNIKDYDLLNRYDDDFIIYLFNEIAQNSSQEDNQSLYAKKGTKLIARKFKFKK